MTLNLISNFASNVALKNLTFNSDDATKSVAKLTSGSRVNDASDDAASLAIGTRLNTEVLSLTQASVNAGQATSLLQIADGALARVQEILTRAKVLSVQAGSQNLGNAERALIDVEFQQLLAEVDRLVNDTEFNGAKLLSRSSSKAITSLNGADTANIGYFTNTEDGGTSGVVNITARGFRNRALTDGGDGAFTVTISAGSVTANDGLGGTDNLVVFSATALGQTGSISFHATINSELLANVEDAAVASVIGDLVTGTTLVFTQDRTGTGIFAAGSTATSLTQYTQDNAELTLSLDTDFDIRNIFTAANAANYTSTFVIIDPQLGLTNAGPSEDFTFKVGTGIIPSEDNITILLSGANVENLGLSGASVRTASKADSASQALSLALEFVVKSRADVGAGINRLDAASRNITTSIENQEAARSRLLDLDVAAEVTTFTNKQILVQAGISTLAQANQLPQNLLRLFQ